MKLSIAAAALFAAALPAAPASAHCGTVHHRASAHRAVHRVAYRAPVRQRAVRTACACERRVAHRAAIRGVYREAYVERDVYPVVYRPHVVSVTYERPLYRPHRVVYGPRYPLRPVFYGARYAPYRHGYVRAGFRHDGFARWDGPRRERYWR